MCIVPSYIVNFWMWLVAVHHSEVVQIISLLCVKLIAGDGKNLNLEVFPSKLPAAV